MLALMCDPQVPIDPRLDMAAAAAPFVHARPRPSSRGRPHPMELRARRAKAAAPSGGGDGGVPGGEENPALQPALAGGDEKHTFQPALPGGEEKPTLQPTLPGRPEKAGLASADEEAAPLTALAPDATRPSTLRALNPLEFLIAVMTDPEATPRQRMRAAKVAAPYKHRPPEELPYLVEDEFGFKIDPAVAKAVCEIKRQALRSDTRKQERLAAWLREHIETIECPDSYGGLDLENDEKRLQELRERRGTKVKPNAEEDAEEAYLTTRAEVYRATPAYQQANLARKAQIDRDIEWVRAQVIESRARSERIRTLALRHLDQKLTPAEEHELEELRRRYPEQVESTSKWAVRRMADIRAMRERLQQPNWGAV
jgi:uncharacterized protein YnzC (UPF0291/DUF896 family)